MYLIHKHFENSYLDFLCGKYLQQKYSRRTYCLSPISSLSVSSSVSHTTLHVTEIPDELEMYRVWRKKEAHTLRCQNPKWDLKSLHIYKLYENLQPLQSPC